VIIEDKFKENSKVEYGLKGYHFERSEADKNE
jgi:hypothetical protein